MQDTIHRLTLRLHLLRHFCNKMLFAAKSKLDVVKDGNC